MSDLATGPGRAWRRRNRRQALAVLLLTPLLVASAAAGSSPRQEQQERPAAFLDQLLARARAAGPTAYRARPAKIDGVSFPRSLVVEVSADDGPAAGGEAAQSEGGSRLSFSLDGRYERFAVTLGRDDADAERGGGLARFEILADERSIYRSPLMRSSCVGVRVPRGVTARSSAVRLNLDVRGVRTLHLVTRFASDVPQQGTMVRWARGCVWGDPRLYGGDGGDSGDSVESSDADPVRDALRIAALRAAAALAPDAGKAPLRLAVPPLPAPPRDFPGGARRAGEVVRLLREQALAVRRGGSAVFALLDRGAESRFQRGLRVGRGGSAPSPEAAARSAGAHVLMVPALVAPPSPGEPWRLELRVTRLLPNPRTGTPPLAPITVPIPADLR